MSEEQVQKSFNFKKLLMIILIVVLVAAGAGTAVLFNISSKLDDEIDVDFLSESEDKDILKNSLITLLTNNEISLSDDEVNSLLPVLADKFKKAENKDETDKNFEVLKYKFDFSDLNCLYLYCKYNEKEYYCALTFDLVFKSAQSDAEITVNSLKIGSFDVPEFILKKYILPNIKFDDSYIYVSDSKIVLDIDKLINQKSSKFEIKINDFSISEQKLFLSVENPFEELISKAETLTGFSREKIITAFVTEYLKDGNVNIMDLIKYIF